MNIPLLWYGLVFMITFLGDRITKYGALNYCAEPVKVNEYLSFNLVFNRGVSWGWLHSDDTSTFILVTLMILALTGALIAYAISQWRASAFIMGEVLVISGGISNLIDRLVYHGVIDFIAVACPYWQSPIFNVADVCIVIGVGIMVIVGLRAP